LSTYEFRETRNSEICTSLGGVNEFVSILFTHMPSDFGEVQYRSSVTVQQG